MAAAIGLPSGTVCFLFSDVVGSARLWDEHPVEMQSALQRHDEILRNAIEDHRGYVFSTAGDAFSAAFRTAGDTVGAAVGAQRMLQFQQWPPGVDIVVRMGVHVGTAEERGGDYFGTALNRTARVMGLAHGGQILVSRAVEELVRDSLPDGVRLVGLGEVELRGLSHPEEVFQVSVDGLVGTFPALTTPSGVPGNAPSPATSFVGRVDEVKRIAARLPTHRLLTLVGPGGVGKTRLAIETAATVTDEFPDGCWFVELAPLSEPDAVVQAVGATLSIPPESGLSMLEAIVDTVAGRRLLVVLDNCEHVIGAAAEIAAAIGAGAPGVKVLATSREPLGVAGEQVWPVPPLDPVFEAAELFIERARSAHPSFELSDSDRDLLGRLCASLDGIPLAVELAASRVRSMTIADMADRLGDRFRLLRAGRRRGGDERQQTMRATVEWSYRLLEPDERLLFDRLSVFAGDFDLAAAEAVCGDDKLDELDIVDVVDALVDRSMVQVDRTASRARFSLLETLRQYGTERLQQRGKLDELRDRHLAYYAQLAQQAREWFQGARNHDGRELFVTEWDNLRAALEHAEARGDDGRASSMISDTTWYTFYAGRQEHGQWAQRRIESWGEDDPWMLGITAMWAFVLGDQARAIELGKRGIDAAGSPDDPATVMAWGHLSCGAWYSGHREEALRADTTLKDLAAKLDDNFTAAHMLSWVSPIVSVDPDKALAFLAAAQQRVKDLGNETIDAQIAFGTAQARFASGDRQQALGDWHRAADLGLRSKNHMTAGAGLAMVATRSPQITGDDPKDTFLEAIEHLYGINARGFLYWALTGLAHWWATNDQITDAARVIGFLDVNDPEGYPTVADLRTRAVQIVEDNPNTGPPRTEGKAMTRDEIVLQCLSQLRASDRSISHPLDSKRTP